MIPLLTVETILLILLALVVAGLLRSHAEILRRLEGTGGTASREPTPVGGWVDPSLPPARPSDTPAYDVVGVTLDGDPVKVAVVGTRHDTLIAFLSSGCTSCLGFWEALRSEHGRRLPDGTRLVVVTKDGSHESPATLRELAPPDAAVVLSSQAWESYRIQGSPYFIYVDGTTGTVAGEGTAGGWDQVRSLLRDAVADARLARAEGRPGSTGTDRARRLEDALARGGIGPGHPSLYAPKDGSKRAPTEAVG